jgi:hypothetical protein
VSVLRWIGGDGDERVVLSRFGLSAAERGQSWAQIRAFGLHTSPPIM